MNFRVVLGLVLLAAALVSGWSLWRNRVVEEEARAASGRSEYVLRQFELTALDKAGKESFTLRAPLLRETPGANTMELTTPLFLLPDAQGKYWEVRSKTGWVSEDRQEVRLRGDVVASNQDKAAQPAVMRTEQLNVFPQKHQATSPVRVTVTQPGSTMQGVGMRADLRDKRIQLLSQVRGTYD